MADAPQPPRTQPDWLAERRAKARRGGARAGPARPEGPRLGVHRPLEARPLRLRAGRARRRRRADATGEALAIPEGSTGLTQVDGSVLGEVAAELSGNGRPDGPPVVLPLDAAAARYPELVGERLGTIVSGEGDPFVTINEAGWSGGALVYVPRNSQARRSRSR